MKKEGGEERWIGEGGGKEKKCACFIVSPLTLVIIEIDVCHEAVICKISC